MRVVNIVYNLLISLPASILTDGFNSYICGAQYPPQGIAFLLKPRFNILIFFVEHYVSHPNFYCQEGRKTGAVFD